VRNTTRRDVIRAAVCAPIAWSLGACAVTRRTQRFDLVVHGGTLIDGSGGVPRFADVGVQDGRITAIGDLDREQARRAIDARGLIVSPGFVDLHSHSDRSILEYPAADSRILQGYTAEITGNCGGSAAPTAPGSERPFAGVREYLRALDAARPAIHQALLVGHGTLRENLVGEVDRRLTATEMRVLERELERALDEGAFGLSSGLEYVPGIYSPPEELLALARVVARRGRLYASHMRSEDRFLLEAIDEILALARSSGARVQISHLKSCGPKNWPKLDAAFARIEAAVADGFDVRADAYPYTAYSTGLTILLEAWVKDGGNEPMFARFADPTSRARIRSELALRVDNEPGGFDRIVIASELSGDDRALTGLSIEAVAERWRVEPTEAFLRLLEHERGGISYVGHAMQESDVARVLAHRLVCVGSDGYVQPAHGGPASKPHPRSFGTAPRVLGRYCRELRAFDLATAVQKLSSAPADRAGLAERGRIERGFHADLVVFDAERVRDRATFDDPRATPEGILHVVVAGRVAVQDSVQTGERAGTALTPAGEGANERADALRISR